MVNIMGSKASLLSTPTTKANEQTNSPKMANDSDRALPNPRGSGKPPDICSNPSNFCKPCDANNRAKTTRATNKKAAVLQRCCTSGNKNFNTLFIFYFIILINWLINSRGNEWTSGGVRQPTTAFCLPNRNIQQAFRYAGKSVLLHFIRGEWPMRDEPLPCA